MCMEEKGIEKQCASAERANQPVSQLESERNIHDYFRFGNLDGYHVLTTTDLLAQKTLH